MVKIMTVDKTAGAQVYSGLSTDEKPEKAYQGSMFIELDTSKLYLFDEENGTWTEWEG